jgi:hypothetical protein
LSRTHHGGRSPAAGGEYNMCDSVCLWVRLCYPINTSKTTVSLNLRFSFLSKPRPESRWLFGGFRGNCRLSASRE